MASFFSQQLHEPHLGAVAKSLLSQVDSVTKLKTILFSLIILWSEKETPHFFFPLAGTIWYLNFHPQFYEPNV